MWKKVCLSMMALIGMITVGYGYYNLQIGAAPASIQYYEPGDTFERTGKSTFEVNGMTWKIIYSDSSSGIGYAISENIAIKYNCPKKNAAGGVLDVNVDGCMALAQSVYSSGTTKEEMGVFIKNISNGMDLTTLRSMRVSEYDIITNNEIESEVSRMISFSNREFWMEDRYNDGRHVYFWHNTGIQRPFNGHRYIDIASPAGSTSALFGVIEINLPQKGTIKSITADTTNITKPYTDAINNANQTIVNIDTNEGEGPYHFYVYDTSASGSGTYATPSQYFSLNANSAQGNAKINLIKQLPAGDYYFKVKVVDESMNERMYHTPNDFTKDTFRVKETGVIHVKIEKVPLTIAFDQPSDTKKTIAEAANPWSETASATPFNSDLQIKYTIVGGDIGLINLDENTGTVTYKGNGAFGKVKIRATVDEHNVNEDNYEAAYAEKEIIIAQEVDGVIIPDSASSDHTTPTFSANDPNVKNNGTIGTIKGTLGTPDVIGGNTTTYSYAIKAGGDGSFFKVNANNGVIQCSGNLAVGSYTFMITVSDKWTSKDISVTVNVGVAKAENLLFYESSTSNTVINTKIVNFTDKNVSVFATVKGSSNNNPVSYKIKDGSTNVITVNANSGAVTIVGAGTVTIVAEKKGATGQADAIAELTFTVTAGAQNFIYTTDSTLSTERPKTGNQYSPLKETYAPNKTFKVYTTGNPPGSNVTYQLKGSDPSDVISVDPDGTIHILNASKNDQIGKVIVQATSHDPSGNYDDKTIELPINIEKGTRTVTFAENPIYVINGSGSVVPNILVDGILDTENNATIEVDSSQSSIAWTNYGVTIQYNWNDAQGKDVKLHVTKPADRNYKIAEGDGILHILGADESALTLNTPGKIIYGDHFTIRSTQDDSASTNVQYTFETDNQVFISAPQVNGNKAEFDALGNSGSTTINVKVTRTADGELPMTKTVTIKVLPKPITIQIDDKEKKRLEENPPLTYQDFTSQLISWNGVKDSIDTSHIKLSTTAKKYSSIGSYPITSGNAEKQLNDNYPNYTFTIKQGLLNIIDNGNKDFTDIDDDGCPDLNIKIPDDNGNEIIINGDRNDDGIPDYSIDTNGDGKPDLNIDTDYDGKPDLNLVMLKSWKPNRCVTINGVDYASGITAKAEINVDVDGDGIPDINIDNKGDFKPHINISKDGKTASVNLAEIHEWKPDHNYQSNKLAYDSIGDEIQPQTNIDSDGDGRPDINIDLDGDMIPDLNIDTDGDRIPDLDIDSDGDGKPDVNVDVDQDGIADENIKEIIEWKPEHNVNLPFPYDTMNFDSNEPNENDDTKDKHDKEVQGSYYPGANMGGAITGDDTNRMLYIGYGCLSLGMILLILYKQKQEEN